MTESRQALQFLRRNDLQRFVDVLLDRGYDVIGPTVQDETVVYRSIRSVDELPQGWSDIQQPAVYQLNRDSHDRYFRFNSSPDSWKRYLFPSESEIGTAVLKDDGWHFEGTAKKTPKYALLGVRACDLAAIAIQDRVFTENEYTDPAYQRRRDEALIIAVQCSDAVSTCFCTSMGTGPECTSGFDVVITEIEDGFVIGSGSARGTDVLDQIATEDATDRQREDAAKEPENARRRITKHFDNDGVHDLLLDNLDHSNWKKVAERCLSCTNCTMVCPTCFCSTVDDVSNLSQTEISRVQRWDSCFNIDFSYVAGGIVRNDIRSRYRQWLTHKFATWYDQFDESGCVGCGRCITWCPVGIDLTEEVSALRSAGPAENRSDRDQA